MKKFTKLFLSCAAVAAVTAAVATSAMAADVTGDLAGAYDETTGKLSLTTEFSGTTTVLVLAPGANTTSVAADDILYIDQVEDGNLGDMGLKGAPTADDEDALGTYNVLVGSYVDSEFVVKTASFRLGSASVWVGDVNMDDKINLSDATVIVKHATKASLLTDESALIAADTNEDDKINLSDATCIVKYATKSTEGTGIVGEYR